MRTVTRLGESSIMSTKITFPLKSPHDTTSVVPEVKLSDASSDVAVPGCNDVDQTINDAEDYPVSRLWNAASISSNDAKSQAEHGEADISEDAQGMRVEDVAVQNPEPEKEQPKNTLGEYSTKNTSIQAEKQDFEPVQSNISDTETETHKTPARKKSNRLITAFGSLGRFLIILAVTTLIFTPLPWILARIVTGEFIAEFALVSFLFALGAGVPVAFFIFVVSFARNKPLVQFYDDE